MVYLMRLTDIEYWALSVIDVVKLTQHIEDARVELKAEWPDPEKAARRIAGHANAAAGDNVLWLIGVDEATGVIGADTVEFSNWWQQVVSQFSELSPTVTSVNIPIEGKLVVALLFETDRAPFVVKNPKFGSSGAGPVEREVPWREGTRVRSATRADLVRLLVPLNSFPTVEVQDCTVSIYQTNQDRIPCGWLVQMKLYVLPSNDRQLVIPYHYCSGYLQIENVLEMTELVDIRLSDGSRGGTYRLDDQVPAPSNEIIIQHPMQVTLYANANQALAKGTDYVHEASIVLKLRPAGANRNLEINATLKYVATNSTSNELRGKWALCPDSVNVITV